MRWTRGTTLTMVKLVAFATCCVLVAGWLVVRVGNLQLFTSDVSYKAVLTDASGLSPGDKVKLSGVTVGRVNSVGVHRGDALVGFDLEPSVKLRTTTGVGSQWLDVIGDKVLYIYPSSAGRLLKPGGTLPLRDDVADASVGQLLNTLGPFLQAIDPKEQNAFLEAVAYALQGNDAEVHSLISHTAAVSGTIGAVSGVLGTLIENLSRVVSAVDAHRSDVASLADHLANLGGVLKANNGLLDSTVGNLGSAEKDLASLLRTSSGHLDSLISNLQGIASTLDANKKSLVESLHTLPAGLAPYQQISSYGQWFQIDTVFTCLANETSCVYQSPTDEPGGSATSFPSTGSTPGSSSISGYLEGLSGAGS